MIWVWILTALVLSFIPLINKKIELSNYIWLLIPIDAYGISIAGAIIKPYMIFALMLPVILCARNKGTNFELSANKSQLLAGVISVLIVVISIINSDTIATVKASILTLIVYVCAQFYVSCTNESNSEQLSDVFIASCFGCGIVCILAYLMLQSGIDIGGIVAPERAQDGLFMKTSNMSNGQYIETYRLRGFAYDPNTMFPQFVFGLTACVSRLFKKFNLYYIITIVISILCIILSGSRMALLCAIFAVVITAISKILQSESIKKKVLSIISTLAVAVGLMLIAITQWGQNMLSALFLTYSNRSSLTDKYGRFSIWQECLEVYWEKNPLLGVGLGRMDEFTTTERMTHNTWLEFICECGAIVGGIAIIYFMSVMVIGWVKTKSKHLNDPQNTSYLCLVIGYTATIISLVSVDNVTNSYLWFSALLLIKMAAYRKSKTQIE